MTNDALMNDLKTTTRMDPLDASMLREHTLVTRLFEVETEKLEVEVRALRLEAEKKEHAARTRRETLKQKGKELKDYGTTLGVKYACGWRDFNIETGEITRRAPALESVPAEVIPLGPRNAEVAALLPAAPEHGDATP